MQTEAYYRGSVYRSLHNNEDALKDFNTVLKRDPGNILALCERSSILRDNAKYDEAWRDIEKVLTLSEWLTDILCFT